MVPTAAAELIAHSQSGAKNAGFACFMLLAVRVFVGPRTAPPFWFLQFRAAAPHFSGNFPLELDRMRSVRRFFQDRTGSTVIEYGLIAALISVAIISGVGAFGDNLSGVFNHVANTVSGTSTADAGGTSNPGGSNNGLPPPPADH
jgi:pilus assembly protein Flp/PilA